MFVDILMYIYYICFYVKVRFYYYVSFILIGSIVKIVILVLIEMLYFYICKRMSVKLVIVNWIFCNDFDF